MTIDHLLIFKKNSFEISWFHKKKLVFFLYTHNILSSFCNIPSVIPAYNIRIAIFTLINLESKQSVKKALHNNYNKHNKLY